MSNINITITLSIKELRCLYYVLKNMWTLVNEKNSINVDSFLSSQQTNLVSLSGLFIKLKEIID
jgi:hypothetical protein